MEHRLFHSVTHGVPLENLIRPCCAVGFEVGWGVGVQGWGGGRSGRVVLIDNGRVYQSKGADALVQVKTTTFGTNGGLNMLLNISSRYFGGLFWSRQLRGLPSSDGYFLSRSSIKFQGHTGQKIANFDPNWAFLDCNCSLNSPIGLKLCTKLDVTQKRCPIVFWGHPSNLKVTWIEKSMILIQF